MEGGKVSHLITPGRRDELIEAFTVWKESATDWSEYSDEQIVFAARWLGVDDLADVLRALNTEGE